MRSQPATIVGIFAMSSIAVCTSERCSPCALTGEKRPSPLTTVRSTSIGHAVFGTFCIALTSGSGSARRDAELALEHFELVPIRQMTVEQEVDDLFERRVRREIVDVVTAIG